MKGDIVGLIPVKGSSDRVKQKNLRDFAGSSLLEVKLNQLKEAKGFADLIVSSEDKTILEISKKNGNWKDLRVMNFGNVQFAKKNLLLE